MQNKQGKNIIRRSKCLFIVFAFILAAGILGFGDRTRAADYRFTIEHQGIERFYLTHIPESYESFNQTPLILAFHGGGGNAEGMSTYYNFIEESENEGYIVVFPNGASRFANGNLATWNAGTCCSYAVESNSDDVGFVRKILEDIKTKFNIDETRIYATGMSNGGMFSYRLACEMSDEFTAIAAVAGTENILSCNPLMPIPVFHIHALNDGHVYFDGGCSDCSVNSGLDYISVNETVNRWVLRNNCDLTPNRVLEITGDDGVYCDEYAGCDNSVKVKVCATQDGGHSWPGGQKPRSNADTPSTAIDATEMIWDFFEEYSVSRPDTTPPSRSNPQPTGTLSSGTTSTTISLDTNETAICKYDTASGVVFDQQQFAFNTTGSTSHSQAITNLSDGEAKTYYIRCQDEAGNANPDDNFTISFSIASPSTTYSISNFINLVIDWLKTETGLISDVNNDGVVNTRDLGIMMSNWSD